ncbi:MAG: tetratricopeptide repeat protein [Bryobacter sp.]|nr:tetratricopeptide repeat protein [Bryobacter sp.]
MDKSLQEVIKHDEFVETVGSAADYVSHHRKQVILAIVGVVVLAIGGYAGWTYYSAQKLERQQAFSEVVGLVAEAQTRDTETTKKIKDGFNSVITKYPGSEEANLAKYLTGNLEMEAGNATKAEEIWKESLKADAETANLARYSLAEYYTSLNRTEEAEKLYREILAKPTYMVPKEQATLALARSIAKTKPEEARKLLEPLRSERSPISSPALEILGTLPAAPAPPAAKK